MFKPRLDSQTREVSVTIDGREMKVPAGLSAAAALLAYGEGIARTTPISGTPRAPYCLMGVCFDCLMQIDGVPNQQGCLIQVRDGMSIERQLGGRAVTS
jgi:predicted molibdopterin-dependent oxidoreductase YjgC